MLGNSNLRTVVCPSVKSGSVPPSPSTGFSFREARKMRSISRQPSEMTHLPFAVKEWPPQSKVTVTASYTYGSADAHSSLKQTNRNKLRSPRADP